MGIKEEWQKIIASIDIDENKYSNGRELEDIIYKYYNKQFEQEEIKTDALAIWHVGFNIWQEWFRLDVFLFNDMIEITESKTHFLVKRYNGASVNFPTASEIIKDIKNHLEDINGNYKH